MSFDISELACSLGFFVLKYFKILSLQSFKHSLKPLSTVEVRLTKRLVSIELNLSLSNGRQSKLPGAFVRPIIVN
jgi:hypothetical protein